MSTRSADNRLQPQYVKRKDIIPHPCVSLSLSHQHFKTCKNMMCLLSICSGDVSAKQSLVKLELHLLGATATNDPFICHLKEQI